MELRSHRAVEFIACGSTRGTAFVQRERSRFRRIANRWYDLDGKAVPEPARDRATVGRNRL
jgi:uncharacterized protein YchJ